jgi:hypothetical protein
MRLLQTAAHVLKASPGPAADRAGHGVCSQVIRASTNVQRGRELTICYLEGFTALPRAQRREALWRDVNFVCHCEVTVVRMPTLGAAVQGMHH